MEEELKVHGERIIDSFRSESAESHRSNKIAPMISSEQLLKDMLPKLSSSFESMNLPNKAHVKNFSAGHIFEEDSNRKLPDIKVQQVPFVPLSLALKHVRRIEEDMKHMHEQHKSLLIEIDNCYAGIEQETHNKYREFIEKWKDQMKHKQDKYKRTSHQLKSQNETYRNEASGNIETLREKVNNLTAEKNDLLQRYNTDVLIRGTENSALVKTLEEDYSKRVSTLKAYEAGHVRDISSLVIELILSRVDRAITENEASDPLYRLDNSEHQKISGDNLRNEFFKTKRELKKWKGNKDAIEKQLDEWNTNFEKENNRKANNSDKAKVKPLYLNYLKLNKEGEGIRKRLRQIKEQADKEGINLEPVVSDQVSSINKDLIDDNKLLKVENDKLKKQLAQGNKDKSTDLEKELAKYSAETQELKKALDESERRYINTLEGERAEKESLNRELHTLKASLFLPKDSDDPEASQLKAQLTGYSQEIEQLRKDISKFNAEKTGLEQENHSNKEKLKEFEMKIEELQFATARIAVLEAENESLRAIEKQFAKYPPLKVLSKKQRGTISDLESQIIQLKAALAASASVLIAPNSSDSDQVAALRKELDRLSKETQDAYQMLSLKDQEFKSSSKQNMASVTDELELANLKIAELQAKVSSGIGVAPSPDIHKYTSRIKQLESEVHSLKLAPVPIPVPVSNPQDTAELEKLRKEMKQIKEKYEKEISSIKTTEETAKESEEKLKEAITQFRKLEKSKVDIETELKQTVAKEAALVLQIESLQVAAGEAVELDAKVKELTVAVTELKEKNVQKEQELKDSLRQRKLLHNQLEDLKGKIRVYCRIRPMNRSELQKKCTNVLTISDEFTVNSETKQGQIKPFVYDSVFGPNSNQDEIFEDTKRLIQSAVDGYNVCIFAYGQTGSGKTFTIQGDSAHPGVIPRAIEEMFSVLGKMPRHYSWSVTCYMIEIYLDCLVDLLIPNEMRANPPQLNIKKDIKGMVVIPEAYLVTVTSPDELYNIFLQGNTHRHTSSTKMNDTSSRSHLIFSILIDVTNNETNQRTVGKLSLVDLAGSERVKKTDATADRLREGRAINKSLTALGDVISALSSGESHIPYRNNKLTMLMSDSLGGTAKTLMFVNVSPADYNREETLMSLYYASRVKLITNEPIKNIESKEMSKLKQELIMLQVERDNYRRALEKSGIRPDAIVEMIGQEAENDFDSEKYDDL